MDHLQKTNKTFRKDINFLRALAVISVTVYHFAPNLMTGGFVGVDIFFVISGFLMTSIIFRGLEKNSFSFTNFFIARVNRIVPALLALCIIIFLFGLFVLTPKEFALLSKHVLGSLGFVSNMMFAFEAGYFDSASHEKWLLHTWSLSAEWQFYILYPVFLLLLYKFLSRKLLTIVVIVAAMCSFTFCIFYGRIAPDLSYFFLPTRIWEMLMGTLVFLCPWRFKKLSAVFSLISLLIITGSFFLINEPSYWPNYLAVFPVLGTAFFILCNHQSRLVETGPIQYIGRWSYSIYLWHWPLVVGIYYFELSEIWIFIGFLASFFFGFLSYRFVETLNWQTTFKSRLSLVLHKPIAFSCALIAIGLVSMQTKGAFALSASKLNPIMNQLTISPMRDECHSKKGNEISFEESCEYFGSNATWAVFGDSHGVELAYALAKVLEKSNEGLRHMTYSWCPPSFNSQSHDRVCSDWTDKTIKELTLNQSIQNVVIIYRYSAHMYQEGYGSEIVIPDKNFAQITQTMQEIASSLDEMVTQLAQHKKRVFVVLPYPELYEPIGKMIRDTYRQGKDVDNIKGMTLNDYAQRHNPILEHFKSANYASNVTFIDPSSHFCDESVCWAVRNGQALYFDDDHPTFEALSELAKKIID